MRTYAVNALFILGKLECAFWGRTIIRCPFPLNLRRDGAPGVRVRKAASLSSAGPAITARNSHSSREATAGELTVIHVCAPSQTSGVSAEGAAFCRSQLA